MYLFIVHWKVSLFLSHVFSTKIFAFDPSTVVPFKIRDAIIEIELWLCNFDFLKYGSDHFLPPNDIYVYYAFSSGVFESRFSTILNF